MSATPPLPTPSGEISAFLSELAREGKSPVTREGYKHGLQDFARWFQESTGEPMTTASCTPHHVTDYKTYLRVTRRLAAATVNRRLAALRSFFRRAEGAGLVQTVPTAKVKCVRATKTPPRALERKQVNRLLRVVESSGKPRDVALITLLLHTGLRVAEVCNLRLGDITLGARSGTLKVHAGKGDRDRSLPLNADVRDALRAWYAVRPRAADDHVFLGQTGKGLRVASR